MDEEIKVLLDKTIKSDILEIGKMDIGSEERKCAIEDMVKIYKLRIDETKNYKDICEKVKKKKYLTIEEFEFDIRLVSFIFRLFSFS